MAGRRLGRDRGHCLIGASWGIGKARGASFPEQRLRGPPSGTSGCEIEAKSGRAALAHACGALPGQVDGERPQAACTERRRRRAAFLICGRLRAEHALISGGETGLDAGRRLRPGARWGAIDPERSQRASKRLGPHRLSAGLSAPCRAW